MSITKEEKVIPINEWETMQPNARSKYLRNNRYFLLRYRKENEVTTHVVLGKFDDSVIIK